MPDRVDPSADPTAQPVAWTTTLETLGLCLLYVTAFWGQAARLLPPPFEQWHSLLYRAVGPFWHDHVALSLGHREQLALYRLIEGLLVALSFPLGLVNAALTVITGSIWPNVAARWALDLVPMGWHG